VLKLLDEPNPLKALYGAYRASAADKEMTMPKRLAHELILIAGLALGSCSRPAIEDKVDVADVNARNALARVDTLESRVDELEEKLGQ
jgi:hypothetical protein